MKLRTANIGFIRDVIEHLADPQDTVIDIRIYSCWEHGEIIYYIEVCQKL